MSKLFTQPRLFFVTFFVASFMLALLPPAVRAHAQVNQGTDPWLQSLSAQHQQPVQQAKQYTPAQWEYIQKLFQSLTLGTLSEDQHEELEEYFDQYNEELHQQQGEHQQVQQQQQYQQQQQQAEQQQYQQKEEDDDENKQEQQHQQQVEHQQYQQKQEDDDENKQEQQQQQQYQQKQEEDDNSEEENCKGYKAYPNNLSFYLQFDGSLWIKRPCPPGLGFDVDKCACVIVFPSYKTTTTTAATTSTNPTTTTQPSTTTTTPTTSTSTSTTTRRTSTTSTPTTTSTSTTTTSTTPTTTTRRTTTEKPSLDLCKECVMLHGVGYAPYPGHCEAYIQCEYYGDVPSSVNIRHCPSELQWNQDKLTCDFPEDVKCKSVVTRCSNQKAISGDKQSYLAFNGYSWSQVRCPPNKMYSDLTCDCVENWGGYGNFETCLDKKAIPNDKTGFLQLSPSGWMRMPCPKSLGYDSTTCRCTVILDTNDHYTNCPNMKPIIGDKSGYFQFNGVSWVRMPCPATVGYNPRTCQCSDYLTGNDDDTSESVDKDDDVCKASLKLTFDDNSATDTSQNEFWVNNTGVTFSNGKAYFDGKSRLTVPGFSNMELGNTVFITIKYSQNGSNKQTLVTNGDCGVLQSYGVCSGQDSVEFFAETATQQAKVYVTKMVNSWQYVMYSLYKDHLKGYAGTRSFAQEAKGSLARRQRGLIIGGGGECDGFNGAIDEIHVFLCHPGFA